MVNNEKMTLPDDLPEPEDDGATEHLIGKPVPSVNLVATNGETIDLSELQNLVIVYCYPKIGRPDQDVSPPGWDDIPGARGCTPESCGFRDDYQEIVSIGVDKIFGLSLQPSDYQQESKERLNLPFELLSDANHDFTHALQLPTFKVAGELFLKRHTLVFFRGRIEHVFYPVFPPDTHAAEVVRWLKNNFTGK